MRRVPPDYTLTRADPEEIGRLVEINLASDQMFAGTGLIPDAHLGENVPEDVLEDAVPGGHLFVVRDGRDTPVGFALTSLRGDGLYLDQVSVHPDHGRKGIGAALVDRVVSDARDRGLKVVTLSTFRDVPWNGPFYRKLGFRDVRRDRLEPWMEELEELQAETLDVTKRCFMRRKLGWF